jgi:hypothetical protein
MLKMAVGHSDDVDPNAAVIAVIDQCRRSLEGLRPRAGLLFCTVEAFDPSMLKIVGDEFPGMELAGATSSSEISSVGGYLEDSISLALFASEDIEIGTGLGRGLRDDVDEACEVAVRQALSGVSLEPKVCIVLHESLATDPPLVAEGLARALPEGVAVLGGTSARNDFTSLRPTYQFRGQEVASDGLAIIVFCGPVAHSTAVGMGFKTIGSRGTVTNADRGGVYEIDGRPAIEFVKRYIDALGPAAFSNPLAVFEEGSEDFYLRAIGPSDRGAGSFATVGSIPVGVDVQVTTADVDDVLTATRESLETALAAFPSGARPEAALIFSCAVRKFFLGTKTRVEAELAKEVLGDLPTTGLYCYGEVGPVPGAPTARFLNETFVTLLLGS